MSKLNVYAIRDTKTEAYARPFYLQNDDVMKRALINSIADEQSLFHTNTEDFQCFHLGTFDEKTGIIEAQPPVHKINLIDLEQ
jgi:hypothetical protein